MADTTTAPPRILVADKLSAEGIQFLESEGVDVTVRHGMDPDELAEAAVGMDAVLVRSAARVTDRVFATAKALKVVGRAGIGVDNIDVEAATERGVLVMNVPDANANTTAEHALSLLFALARNVPRADRSIREGKWERSKFMGTELTGKVLGVLGGGNIGRRVATRASGLGFEVIVHDPFLPENALEHLHIPVVPLDDFLERSDFITIHTPLLDSTRGLINRETLAKMKTGVRIVNCARGGIVNESDLEEALKSGKVAGAALDVFEKEPLSDDHPLLGFDNVVLTPHLGASTSEAQTRASVDLCRQVLDYLRNGAVKNALNLPRVSADVLDELEPWNDLGRRLGTILTNIVDGPWHQLQVSYQGRRGALDTTTVTRSVVAGLLGPAFEFPVNVINAMKLAEERGLSVEEHSTEKIRDFASMITARVTSETGTASVSGAMFGHRQPRLVKVDDFHLEAIPEGVLLLVRNEDCPGVVGSLGSLLGEAGVNIRAMHLSPPRPNGSDALALINVDPDVSAQTLDTIRSLPKIQTAQLVHLDPTQN